MMKRHQMILTELHLLQELQKIMVYQHMLRGLMERNLNLLKQSPSQVAEVYCQHLFKKDH